MSKILLNVEGKFSAIRTRKEMVLEKNKKDSFFFFWNIHVQVTLKKKVCIELLSPFSISGPKNVVTIPPYYNTKTITYILKRYTSSSFLTTWTDFWCCPFSSTSLPPCLDSSLTSPLMFSHFRSPVCQVFPNWYGTSHHFPNSELYYTKLYSHAMGNCGFFVLFFFLHFCGGCCEFNSGRIE